MFHVVLHRPEIPPNTGNVIRLCANTGARLHLVHPLGFRMEDAQLRRAGLDYHEWAEVEEHADFAACQTRLAALGSERMFAFTAHRAAGAWLETRFVPGDSFLFGSETAGLPDDVLAFVPDALRLRLPMRPGQRSLNLSNAVAVVVFEAWRQQGYAGGT
jgi:tRNA (cytidine/uridine-2'-O-)-methyltransferase